MTTYMKGLVAAGLLTIAGMPTALQAQRSGVEIWSQNCGRCHTIQPANRYTADQWETIMADMMIFARLTDDESAAVLEFLQGGAKRVAAEQPAMRPRVVARLASRGPVPVQIAEPDGAELYRRQCQACHGASGAGNGPAAAALNPKPADFTTEVFQQSRSDEQLTRAIAEGKNTMPGFSNRLNAEDIAAIVRYIRTLAADQGR